jgi:hypothetical protein
MFTYLYTCTYDQKDNQQTSFFVVNPSGIHYTAALYQNKHLTNVTPMPNMRVGLKNPRRWLFYPHISYNLIIEHDEIQLFDCIPRVFTLINDETAAALNCPSNFYDHYRSLDNLDTADLDNQSNLNSQLDLNDQSGDSTDQTDWEIAPSASDIERFDAQQHEPNCLINVEYNQSDDYESDF